MDIKHLSYLYCALLKKTKKDERRNRKRSKWCKDWLLKRTQYSHINLLTELRCEPQDWFNYLRMDEDSYLLLLSLVSPIIEKRDTIMRSAISPHERLTATLRFLTTGRSYEDLKFSTIISPQALGQIIPETCQAIVEVLQKDYVKFPKDEYDWLSVANTFKQWNFPQCLGAMDGKHVAIVQPPNSGSFFYNYKGFRSMVLLAIANGNYEIIMYDFGTNGRISDGGVLEHTEFYKKLETGSLNLPKPEITNGSELPYVFVGDEAFALRPDFLKPFPQRDLTKERRIYNYRLSRARRIIENVFGILVARFRIFEKPINLGLNNIEKVVTCCCVLHNFLRFRSDQGGPRTYIQPEDVDVENFEDGSIKQGLNTASQLNIVNLQRITNMRVSPNAQISRNAFLQYFNNEGKVPWQEKMCGF